jgi:ubiquinone/menaquinone biosynthesis C-methylase UbiE
MKVYEYERNYNLENNYWWFVGVRRMVHMLLQKSGVTKIEKCLDIGCGTGALLDELKPKTKELYGADISPEALSFCSERGHPADKLIQCSAEKLPFPDNYFDVVTAIGLIEHVREEEKFIMELNRIMKPNGVLIMLTSSFPFLWSEHDDANEHLRRYYLTDIKNKFEDKNLVTIKLSHMNFFLFPAIAVTLKLNDLFRKKDADPERIMPIPPAFINSLLTFILTIETFLMTFMRLPWGVSMIGSFRKKA